MVHWSNEGVKMKKVLILGAGLLQSFVIKRAKELGYYTICADMNKSAIGFQYADSYRVINIIDKEACLKYAEEFEVDGVLTAATDYGVLTASFISEKMQLKGLNYDIAQVIKNKYTIRKKLSKLITDDIQYFEVTCEEDIKKIRSKIKYPVIVKPCDGSGSKGVTKVTKELELLTACINAIKISLIHKALVETYITGLEFGAESFIINDEIYVLNILKKNMTSYPCFAELGHAVPSGLDKKLEEKVKNNVKSAIQALGINFGAVNMDLIITSDNKVFIVDIGSRMGGNLIGSHIIPFSTGIDYMGNIIKASVGDKTDFSEKYNRCIASRILSLSPGTVTKVPEINTFMDDRDILDIILNLKKGDKIRKYTNNLDGCGYVVATGININEAERKALNVCNCIDSLIERE